MTLDVVDVTPTEDKVDRVICGKTLVEWDYAVVYVHSKTHPHDLPTHMYFTFQGSGQALTTEVVQLVDQWTHFRGRCTHVHLSGSHEYYRARKMACSLVETYRKNYMKKHGSPPNPLCLPHTLNENLVREKTNMVNRNAKERITGQSELDL